MSDTLYIPTDRLAGPILRFIEVSPLSGCTTIGYDGGAQIVRTDRPVVLLSDGEKRLWALLKSLISGDLRALIDGADGITTAALSDLFARLTFTGRAA